MYIHFNLVQKTNDTMQTRFKQKTIKQICINKILIHQTVEMSPYIDELRNYLQFLTKFFFSIF